MKNGLLGIFGLFNPNRILSRSDLVDIAKRLTQRNESEDNNFKIFDPLVPERNIFNLRFWDIFDQKSINLVRLQRPMNLKFFEIFLIGIDSGLSKTDFKMKISTSITSSYDFLWGQSRFCENW